MNVTQFAALGRAQKGKPYVLGANGPDKFDCSGLCIWLINQAGAHQSDTTADGLYALSVPDDPRPGAMVFLRNNPARPHGIGHVAMILGRYGADDWLIVEARGHAYGVVLTTLSYWKTRKYYAGIRYDKKLSLEGEMPTSSSTKFYSGKHTSVVNVSTDGKYTRISDITMTGVSGSDVALMPYLRFRYDVIDAGKTARVCVRGVRKNGDATAYHEFELSPQRGSAPLSFTWIGANPDVMYWEVKPLTNIRSCSVTTRYSKAYGGIR